MRLDDNSMFMCGDAVEQLSSLEDNSIHTVITSPPYWDQRNYDHDDQLGREQTVETYVDNLTKVFRVVYEKLREDGSVLLNLGDTYTDKKRNRIPHKVVENLCEIGYVHRQDIIWKKTHAKPDPSNDRRSTEHEYVFHLTKKKDYWYDESVQSGEHTSVVTAPTASSEFDHLAVYSEELVEKLLTGVAPPYVCGECGVPYEREYERVPRPFCDPDRKQAVRAAELYEESSLTEEHIEAVQSAGISDVGKATETEDGAGRNSDLVERLAAEAKDVLGGYYREFTMVEREPMGWQQPCSCDSTRESGIVCDPFVGSGTTAVVANRLGLNCIGIDVNETYLDTARQRVKA